MLVKAQGLVESRLLEGPQQLARKTLPKREGRKLGRRPARPVIGERTTGHQSVEMEVGLQHLIPGMEDHDGAELAAQVLTAKLEESFTGGAKEQAEQETFVAKDQRIKFVREGQNGVKVGDRQEFHTPCFPRWPW